MPARSMAQQMAAGAALRRRREGKPGGAFSGASTATLKEFASTSHKGLPYRKGHARKQAAARMSSKLGGH